MQTQYSSWQNQNNQRSKTHLNQLFIPISKCISRSLHSNFVSQSETHRDFSFKNTSSYKYPDNDTLIDRKFIEHKIPQIVSKSTKTPRSSLYLSPNEEPLTKYLGTQIQPYQIKKFRSKSNYASGQFARFQGQSKRYSYEMGSKKNQILMNSQTNEKCEKLHRRGLIQDTKRAVLQFNKDNIELLNDIKKLRNQVSRRASPTKSPFSRIRPVSPEKHNKKFTLSTDYSQNFQGFLKVQSIYNQIKDSKQPFIKFENEDRITDGNFWILKQLGIGTFANVFLAIDKRSGFLVTLKKIKKNILKNKKCEDQLMTEIKIQLFANHPNILKIYGSYADEQTLTLILQFMEEGNLYEKQKRSRTLSEQYASQSIYEILLALKYLHGNKIVHRDIKPENVVISHGVRKLCDFGTAAICLDRRSTVCGTLDYSAPQLIEGQQYNEPLDLWSLGIMTYELLTGKPPFYHLRRKDTIKEIMEYRDGEIYYPLELSAESIDFIGKFLLKDPEKRISIDEALRHKFIEIHADEQTKDLTQKYSNQTLPVTHKNSLS